MPIVLIAVVVLLAAVGLAVGIAVVVLPRGGRGGGRGEVGFSSLRIEADLRDGVEQNLLVLIRELELPRTGRDVEYGHLFIEQHGDTRLLVQSRSQLNRGFVAVIDLARGNASTRLRYALVRLPADETVRERVRQFESQLVGVLQRRGAGESIRATPAALRDLREIDTSREVEDLLPPLLSEEP